jgi:hypothetical protein
VSCLLDSTTAGYSTRGSDVVGCVMEQEFYQGLAQRVRAMADRADPFTRRRLLDIAKRYDAKGSRSSRSGASERPLAASRTTPPTSIFSGPARPDAHARVVLGRAAARTR